MRKIILFVLVLALAFSLSSCFLLSREPDMTIDDYKDSALYVLPFNNMWYNMVHDEDDQIYFSQDQSIYYADLLRDATSDSSQFVILYGEVFQILSRKGKTTNLILSLSSDNDKLVQVVYRETDDNPAVVEEDELLIYGYIRGVKNHTTLLGEDIEVPRVIMQYAEID